MLITKNKGFTAPSNQQRGKAARAQPAEGIGRDRRDPVD
jgi:hypothetical protein